MRHLSPRVCLTVFTIFMAQCAAHGDEVVVPNSLESFEGNSENSFPFNIGVLSSIGLESMRCQQIYSADQFSSLTQPVLITEIRFRPDGAFGLPFDSELPDVQISLSTSSASPDGLSLIFAENVGPDETIVHDGALHLSSSPTGSAPFAFDIVIVLSTPFLYDPSQGNLLMDVRNYGGGFTTIFDAENTAGDSVSRAHTTAASDVDSPTANFASSWGLVTKFTYTPAGSPPPPSSLLVAIDVKPGSDDNQVNLNSNGNVGAKSQGKKPIAKGKQPKKKSKQASQKSPGPVLQVAILTTDDFDATLTVVETVRLGDPLSGGTVAPMKSVLEDVDADGDLDVLMQFSLSEMQSANAIA
ncbi:MAG TPA: hypothetical protein VLA12_15285, partial [Planctomycetaceae bacterium]|nr:hypothetical protein [Planctomycetaceae bacterium]